jgi:sugar phosphate permease
MDEATMGLIDSVYLVSYAVGQFIWGALADKVGPRRVLLTGLLASIVCAVAMGASTWLTAFLVINFLQGLAQSCGWAPLAKNLSCWYSRLERGRILGLWSTNYPAGSVVAFTIAGGAITYFGHWSYAFYVPAACLFAIFLLLYFFHADRPQDIGLPSIDAYHGELAEGQEDGHDAKPETTSWLELILQPMIGLLALTYFLLKPTRYAILLWGPYYVTLKLQTGALFSATIASTFAVAGIFGAIIAGTISDMVFKAKRMPFTVICLIVLSITLFVFDGLVSRTVASVNKYRVSAISAQLAEVAGNAEDAALMRISSDLARLSEQNSLSNPESVERLRNVVEQLNATAATSIDTRVALRTMMIQLRKVARSEQLTFVRAADVYKERIRRIYRNVERLGFEKDDPLLETLSAIRKTRRIEISATVSRLSMVEDILESYTEERPGISGDLAHMRDEIRQTRLDITDYLEDRGDDMSFAYRAQLSDIVGAASPAGMPNELTQRLDDIVDGATLFATGDASIEDALDEIRSAATGMQDAELAAELMEWVSALEFARMYEPQRPPEDMTAAHWVMVACLFLIGFFLYAPDSQIAVAAAIDFGHHKGASSVSGFINGCGAISAIFGGVGVGYIAQLYSWDVLLTVFAAMTLLAGLLLLPKWHTVPTAETE